jgi:hypothetical protein
MGWRRPLQKRKCRCRRLNGKKVKMIILPVWVSLVLITLPLFASFFSGGPTPPSRHSMIVPTALLTNTANLRYRDLTEKSMPLMDSRHWGRTSQTTVVSKRRLNPGSRVIDRTLVVQSTTISVSLDSRSTRLSKCSSSNTVVRGAPSPALRRGKRIWKTNTHRRNGESLVSSRTRSTLQRRSSAKLVHP